MSRQIPPDRPSPEAPSLSIPLDLNAVGPSAPRQAGCGRTIVLVGLMGAGKTTIGRILATTLGLPFVDSDEEIERAAGCSIADLFQKYGEPEFRRGERLVIRRLLSGPPVVLATGGGAFMDQRTRASVREQAVSIWLRCPLPLLVQRVAERTHRPLLNTASPHAVLADFMRIRHPVYAEADIIVDCGDDNVEHSADHVLQALKHSQQPLRVPVRLERASYEVMIGPDVIRRAGALLAPVLPQKRVMIVTDATVSPLHLPRLLEGLEECAIRAEVITIPPGEGSKSMARYEQVTNALLEAHVERGTTVVALGGGVVGDLSGFCAATTLRGLPFVQIPTTLLSQVDSSVGGKTGINTPFGKNLVGAFHQPIAVLADTSTLATLPVRELRAGYAEIVKSGLLGDAALFAWCERHGAAVLAGDPAMQAEAIRMACAFKARVVTADEREERRVDGRALLNLGHTFGHALEAEMGYDGSLLHGEAVSIGLRLAFMLSVRLGYCPAGDLERVTRHLEDLSMPLRVSDTGRNFSASQLVRNMQRDKKMRDGRLSFVLVRGIGQAFTCRDVPDEAVLDVLRADGCTP
ncbi:3-dehydroquinate synthase [Komagataeibacter rhaeticus]|uniref:Multifunctional fusion protein n=1 Tax=Komagataeibacter rhaeticus TaxID=215221 RepID=A0A181C855_9PROT|nr:3-dehydroquinate synthase [Komagataeibacter rhaeticus]ATU73507.1 3-dehydroquinate synthase [Komagataeibacter xylinus]QIP34661.1 3-dehydroquinate synthase [Komagataeibacter rhaeticus]QOC47183.1 3-dehydroquinate synthase [Komagataeibacter rhaeticus]WPP20478.1 3-dehydroquinate synthase [Komagataeibacter rhaeticus]SAY47726.1 3-dehydroquinate synthase [Komagataeibacter rhaeticus]